MYAIGLVISLMIGIVLGLVGGGGSILTVPLVHYFFGTSI
ncbi:MAG: putative membrane protein YfcA, partial [Crocinitomicaceae bacterium]